MKRRNPLTNDADTQYDSMYELFLQDNFTEANKRGQTILKTTPNHEKTILLLGQIALQRKQRPRARERYNKLLETTPGLTAARVWRAEASFGKKKYEDALHDYLYLYENSRKTFARRAKLAQCYAALWLNTIALTYYQKAAELTPQDMEIRFWLIKHLLKLRHYKDAYTQVQDTKDRYYHHKSEYRTTILDEIIALEHLVTKHVHPKSSPKSATK